MTRLWLIVVVMVVGGCSSKNVDGDAGLDVAGDVATETADSFNWEDAPGLDELCGNGVVDDGEECDDGNRMNGDGCDWLCRSGDGETPDPAPDPDVPSIEAVGSPVPVVIGDVVITNNNAMDLECNGEQYSLMYFYRVESDTHMMFRRFTLDGEEMITEYEQALEGSITVDHVWTGSEYGVFFGNPTMGGIAFVRIGETGKRLSDPRLIVDQPNASYQHVTWTGSSYGMTWLEVPDPFPVMCGWLHFPGLFGRFSPTGDSLLGEPTELYRRAEYTPRIAFCPDGAFRISMAILQDTECYHPVRDHIVLMDGTLLSTTSIGDGFGSDVVCHDEGYTIVFEHQFDTLHEDDSEGMYIARFQNAGYLLEPPYRFSTGTTTYAGVRLVKDNLGYVVLWQEDGGGDFPGALDIARVDDRGRIVNSIRIADGTGDLVGVTQYDIATVGDGFAVAWSTGDTIYWQVFR